MIRYLAYGSNLLPARLAGRLSAFRALGAVALPGWSLRFHKTGADGSGKCNIVADPGAQAWGAIYELSAADRDALDRIEGVGYGYHGTTIDVPGTGALYVYLAEAEHVDDALEPFDWYHAFVLEGARHHGFPDHYIERIRMVAPVRDHDEHRRLENLAILRRDGGD